MDLTKPIAVGRTAEVFGWEQDKIVKLYNKGWKKDVAEFEYKTSNIVCDMGLKVPDVFELVEIEDRYGIVYEKITGRSMLKQLQSKPYNVRKYANLLADLQFELNNAKVNDLPKQKDKFIRVLDKEDIVNLDPHQIVRVKEIISKLENGNHLLHGDFHPDNVIMSNDGPVIIDWLTVSQGNPLADFTRTSILLTIGSPPKTSFVERKLTQLLRSIYFNAYQRRYEKLSNCDTSQIEEWRLLSLIYRLYDDQIAEERSKLITMINTSLSQID